MTPDTNMQPKTHVSMKFSLDLRWVVLLLVAAIGLMLFIWKPWSSGTSDRTIEVTGEATIKATPDEFLFYPNYQFTNANKETALAELTDKSDKVTAELKKLGVDDNNIKTNSSGYDYAMPTNDSKDVTYTLQFTVTVDDLELAQKVQDYLVTTTPTGSVSPNPTFSEAKQKELEGQARNEATKDARKKAEQSGENLGFKVGKVKTVSDGTGFSMPFYGRGAEATATDTSAQKSLTLHPGENELPYSVTVVYYIR